MANKKDGYQSVFPVVDVLSCHVQCKLLNPSNTSVTWCANMQPATAGMTVSTDICTAHNSFAWF